MVRSAVLQTREWGGEKQRQIQRRKNEYEVRRLPVLREREREREVSK